MKDKMLSFYSLLMAVAVTIGQIFLFCEIFSWDQNDIILYAFTITIPLNFACIVMLTHRRFKKLAIIILSVLGLNGCFLMWIYCFSYDYLAEKAISEINTITKDSVLIGNSSFFRGEAILDCYREGSSEYHFKMYSHIFEDDSEENLKNYNQSFAAEQIDHYLEEEIKSIYTKPIRFVSSSLSMNTLDNFQLDTPTIMIESIEDLHLYCFIEEENLEQRIVEFGQFLKPYFWNTNCILILFSIDDVSRPIELFDKGFYHDPHLQLRLQTLE